ncbi:MAG: DUF4288 domain-containing protein [Verrucomicrobiota bacterium JB023]|nr:DUF4288 domain-containing protein [Verrucomicrobiota bacterium JB023]
MEEPTQPWYAVKCIFSHPSRAKEGEGNLYEERITLWKAESWNEAFRKAEKEAKEYEAEDCVFIEATDAFHLFDDEIKNGTEVWSGMRDSHFDSDTYIKTFCVSGRERMSTLKDND